MLTYKLLWPDCLPDCSVIENFVQNTFQTKWTNDICSNIPTHKFSFLLLTHSFTRTCTGAEGLLQREPSVLDSAFFPGRATCALTLSMEVQLRQPEWVGVGGNWVAMMHKQWRMAKARAHVQMTDKHEERHQCDEIKWCKATWRYWFQRSIVINEQPCSHNHEQTVAGMFFFTIHPLYYLYFLYNLSVVLSVLQLQFWKSWYRMENVNKNKRGVICKCTLTCI